jgi:pimeloyl-ACP methyl ester carboxylesterase
MLSRMVTIRDAEVDEEGVPYLDGRLQLSDGRTLAWRVWGDPKDRPVVRLQGTASSRIARGPNPLPAHARVIMVDRPGFGHSTRLPGRGLREVADDLTELLDVLELDVVPVVAHSGGAPHALALGACHTDRVLSITVGSGACPILASERAGLVRANAELGPALDEGWEGVHSYLTDLGSRLLSEGISSVLADAPPEDLSRLEIAVRQRRDLERRREALRQGFEGWTDETIAIASAWDFELDDVGVHVDWWHGVNDKTVPLSAAQRLTAGLPDCALHVVDSRAHYLDMATLLARAVA